MLFADTSFLISLLREKDEMHREAKKMAGSISERLLLSDHVFSETITFISKRDGNKAAYAAGEKMLQSELVLVCAIREDMVEALGEVRRFPKISMCDALSAVIMRKLGISKVLSFDSDFDVLGFERMG